MWGGTPFLPFSPFFSPKEQKAVYVIYTVYIYMYYIYVFVCMDVCMCTHMHLHMVKSRLRMYFNRDYFSNKHAVTWMVLYFCLWTLDFCSEESWIHPLGVVHFDRTRITPLWLKIYLLTSLHLLLWFDGIFFI